MENHYYYPEDTKKPWKSYALIAAIIVAIFLIIFSFFIYPRYVVKKNAMAKCNAINVEYIDYKHSKGLISNYYNVQLYVSDDFDSLSPEEIKDFLKDDSLGSSWDNYYFLNEVHTSEHTYIYDTLLTDDEAEYVTKDDNIIYGNDKYYADKKEEADLKDFWSSFDLEENYPYYGMSETSISNTKLGKPYDKKINPRDWEHYDVRMWSTTYYFSGDEKIKDVQVTCRYKVHYTNNVDDYFEYEMGNGIVTELAYVDRGTNIIHSFYNKDGFEAGWEP